MVADKHGQLVLRFHNKQQSHSSSYSCSCLQSSLEYSGKRTRSRAGQEGPHAQAQMVHQSDRVAKHVGRAHNLHHVRQ
jgi:hypothetical protein